MIGFRPPKDLYPDLTPGKKESPVSESEQPFLPFTPKERLRYIGVALKAAFLIGFAFMGGLGLVIFILTQIWK